MLFLTLDENIFVPSDGNFRTGNRIRDVTDGKRYKEQHAEKVRQLPVASADDVSVTLILNTDGLNVQSNPSETAWPIFATIAEISPARRFQLDKILNIALWSGEGHPPMDCIFRYLQHEIDEINQGS